jgi:multiple sugar transport system substrate-binding protein
VLAIPGGVDLAVVYYNKDIFDRYDAAYPEPGWTWDDLLMAATSVRDPDAFIYGLAGGPIDVIPFIYQHGGRVLDDWHRPTRFVVDDPLTIEAITWYASLIHDHGVMLSPREAAQKFAYEGDPGYIYFSQNAAMYLGVFSDQGGKTWGSGARWRMNWGMAPLPRDTHASTLGFVWAYAVSAATHHAEACWEWISFLSQRQPPFSLIPARRSLAKSPIFEEQVGAEAAAIARGVIEQAMIVANIRWADLDLETGGFDETLLAILNGDVHAPSALTELQRQIDGQ